MAPAAPTQLPSPPSITDRIALGSLTGTFPPELVDWGHPADRPGPAAPPAVARPRGRLPRVGVGGAGGGLVEAGTHAIVDAIQGPHASGEQTRARQLARPDGPLGTGGAAGGRPAGCRCRAVQAMTLTGRGPGLAGQVRQHHRPQAPGRPGLGRRVLAELAVGGKRPPHAPSDHGAGDRVHPDRSWPADHGGPLPAGDHDPGPCHGAGRGTRTYAERRTSQGKPTKDIMRCLKRSIARELVPLLKADLQHTNGKP
jgi:hypothetical protein